MWAWQPKDWDTHKESLAEGILLQVRPLCYPCTVIFLFNVCILTFSVSVVCKVRQQNPSAQVDLSDDTFNEELILGEDKVLSLGVKDL